MNRQQGTTILFVYVVVLNVYFPTADEFVFVCFAVRLPQCKTDFQRLVAAKRESYASGTIVSPFAVISTLSSSPVLTDLCHFHQLSCSLAKWHPTEGSGWMPKGVLVAHYNEHKGCINRLGRLETIGKRMCEELCLLFVEFKLWMILTSLERAAMMGL